MRERLSRKSCSMEPGGVGGWWFIESCERRCSGEFLVVGGFYMELGGNFGVGAVHMETGSSTPGWGTMLGFQKSRQPKAVPLLVLRLGHRVMGARSIAFTIARASPLQLEPCKPNH